jgi:sirohydrochlorin ferrochelatase
LTGGREDADAMGLVVVAHGEQRQGASNRALLAHVDALRAKLPSLTLLAGVLNGSPELEDALAQAAAKQLRRLIVYPFFMSGGYYISSALPARIAASSFRGEVTIMAPLGLDPCFADYVLAKSLAAAQAAGLAPEACHLLVTGHGSTSGDASARATAAIAERLKATAIFASTSFASIEQSPLCVELAAQSRAVVVAGLFTGEDRHGWYDVPAAIEECGAEAVYTGPLGALDDVVDVMVRAVHGLASK